MKRNDIMNKINFKKIAIISLSTIAVIYLLFFIFIDVKNAYEANQRIFSYTIKVQNAVESLDKVLERAEVNVNVMVDSISNSYDVSKQQDKAYNLRFIEEINGLVKSVLWNSPKIDGSWFQLNADLPFSAEAYNWFEFKDNQFINVKNLFEETPSLDRKITPEEDPYYFNAIASQKPVWSDIYVDADTKDSMLTLSAPIYKGSTLVGVVGIDICTTSLQQILKDMQYVLGDSELYLLDPKHKIILSQLSHKASYTFLDLFNGSQGLISYQDGLIKKTAIMLSLSNNYKIVIAIKDKVLFRDTNNIVNLVYILFTLLIFSIVLMLIYQFKLAQLKEEKYIAKSIATDSEEVDDESVSN